MREQSDWWSFKDIDYDKAVLGQFHFHLSRVDFLLCEDDTALQNSTAELSRPTKQDFFLRMFKLQYSTNFVQLILRKIINIVTTKCHAPNSISAGAPPQTPLGELTALPQNS